MSDVVGKSWMVLLALPLIWHLRRMPQHGAA